MPYKIAISSSDGKNIDKTFGAADSFLIFEADGTNYVKAEERKVQPAQGVSPEQCESGCGNGCGSGCGGGESTRSEKVELIKDCRCVVCTRIGFPIRKQLERLAISVFDVDCSADDALRKIVSYYDRIDKHIGSAY